MRHTKLPLLIAFIVCCCAAMFACAGHPGDTAARIIAMERAALDRWGKGDVNGYLEIEAPEITYFDPNLEHRIDGHDAMAAYARPFAGKIGISHYDMIDPKVQEHGDTAILTYNLVDDVTLTPDGPAHLTVRWNCTEVYARSGADWKIVHNHWSHIRPLR